MVNLSTPAPEIVAAILDETLPPEGTQFDLAVDPPAPFGKSSEHDSTSIGNRHVVIKAGSPMLIPCLA